MTTAELIASIDKWLISQANRYARIFRADPEDLAQVGRLAALQCVPKYDPARASFLVFVWARVREDMRRFAMRDRQVIIPPSKFFTTHQKNVSLDAPAGEGGEEMHALIPAQSESPDYDASARAARLRAALAKLPPRRRDYILRHFIDGESMAEIGRTEKITREAVRQQIVKATGTLRRTLLPI